MSQALHSAELPPGAMDFIKAGTPQPLNKAVVSEIPPTPVRDVRSAHSALEATVTVASTDDAPPLEPTPTKVPKPRPPRDSEAELLPPRNLVTLSIRVRPEIPDALLRAATERKLKRLKAHRQQEIAAEALTQWLTRNGYLAS